MFENTECGENSQFCKILTCEIIYQSLTNCINFLSLEQCEGSVLPVVVLALPTTTTHPSLVYTHQHSVARSSVLFVSFIVSFPLICFRILCVCGGVHGVVFQGSFHLDSKLCKGIQSL